MSDEPEFDLEPSQYLLYWQLRSVEEHALSGMALDIIGSDQLAGVDPGDTIWIVTLSEESELILCGRLVVGEVVGYEEAREYTDDERLWRAEYYAIAEPGTEQEFLLINFEGLADSLRFEGADRDRFTTDNGRLGPRQLSEIRTLNFESAEMLTVIWQRMTAGEPEIEPDPGEALRIFSEMVSETPDDAGARYNLGVAYSLNNRPEDAAAQFREAIWLQPDNAAAWYNLGGVCFQLRQFPDAIEAFNNAILADGNFAPAHFMLGTALAESGDHAGAIEATERGLEIDPDDPRAHHNIGVACFWLGEHEASIEALNRSLAIFPGYSDAYYFLGRNWRYLGDREMEIESYRRAVDIDAHIDATLALGAAYALEAGDPPETVTYIETGGNIDLRDAEQGFYLAMGSLAMGDRKLPLSQASALDESDPVLAERLRRHIESAGAGD